MEQFYLVLLEGLQEPPSFLPPQLSFTEDEKKKPNVFHWSWKGTPASQASISDCPFLLVLIM